MGCKPTPKAVDLPPPEETSTLGPGDIFILHIIGEDELPTEFTVAPDGTVDVPYVQRITVDGLEPQEISALVRKELMAAQIYTDPSVSVSIKEYASKSITVGGEVKEDGSFPFTPGMMLSDAIAKAGGTTPLAKAWAVVLVRRVGKESKRVVVDYEAIIDNEIPDVPLQAGDRISVPQRPF
ncbi:MAG: polysaccharide export protein [Myxococcales bacterium]|nr:polysaccharide export protein [Myxococcales bacterium]